MYSLWYGSPSTSPIYPDDVVTHNNAICFWAPTMSDDASYVAYNVKYTHTFGAAGQVTFTLPTSNIAYDHMSVRYTVVELRLDGNVIWDGQVESISRDFYNQKSVTVTGALAWLSDTEQYIGGKLTAFDSTSRTEDDYPSKANMTWYILQYPGYTVKAHDEDGVEYDYSYTVGHNRHPFNYGKFYYNACSSDYSADFASFDDADLGSICTSLEAIEKVFRNDAVYFYITYGKIRDDVMEKGETVPEWGRQFNIVSQANGRAELLPDGEDAPSQEIVFGENLLSIDEQISASDIINGIYPLGAYACELDDPKDFDRINITKHEMPIPDGFVNSSGSPWLYYRPVSAGYKMSLAYRFVVFDDVTTPNDLFAAACTYLQDTVYKDLTLNISAVDLKDAGVDPDRLELGYYYRVVSVPHGLDRKMLLSAISLDLQNPANNSYTFGYSAKTLADDVLRSGKSIETHTRDISAMSNRVSSARTAAATADAKAVVADRKAVAAQETADSAVDAINDMSFTSYSGTGTNRTKLFEFSLDGGDTTYTVNSPIGSISVEGKTSINQQSVSYRTIYINGTAYNILMAND